MKKVRLGLLSVLMVSSILISPLQSFAESEEVDFIGEALPYSPEELEIPVIEKGTYYDMDLGSMVTEYEDITSVEYVGGEIVAVNGEATSEYIDPNKMSINSACTVQTTRTLKKSTLKSSSKRLGWHPDFKKQGEKANSFWFGNGFKTANFSLGAGYFGVSVSASISKPGSGWTIPADYKKFQRPAVMADVYNNEYEVKYRYPCNSRNNTTKTEKGSSTKKVWYKAYTVS